MTTLRRELIQKIFQILEEGYQDNHPSEDASEHNRLYSEKIADAILSLRAFSGLSPLSNRMEILKNSDPAWSILAGEHIDHRTIDKNKIREAAFNAFETDMNCPKNWKWFGGNDNEDKAWKILREFVVEQFKKDPKCFQSYHTWRTQPFARGAMSNLAIKRNPENFPASWTDFLASNAMYGKKSHAFQETQGTQESQIDGNGVPISY